MRLNRERERADVEPGEEMMGLRDNATEVQKIGLILIKAHPTYERMESSRVRMG